MNHGQQRTGVNHSPRRSRATSFVRVAVVLSVLVVASCWALVRVARAQLAQAALVAGEKLSEIDPPDSVVHRLRLNGEVLHLFTETVPAPLAAVLDQAEVVCRAGGSALATGPAGAGELTDGVTATSPSSVSESWPLLRQQTAQHGTVACLIPAGSGGVEHQLARLRQFGETGDLAELGRFLYVYARRLGKGRTRRMLVYNPGCFRTRRLFAKGDEDAAGGDLGGVARPPGAVRLLTAAVESTVHAVAVYRVTRAPMCALESMSHRLASQGWHAVPLPASVTGQARAYQRRAVDLLVLAAPLEDGTALTLVRSHSR